MKEGPRVTCAAPGDVSLVSAVDASATVGAVIRTMRDHRAARAGAVGAIHATGAHSGVSRRRCACAASFPVGRPFTYGLEGFKPCSAVCNLTQLRCLGIV
jgi:hypothetical protein